MMNRPVKKTNKKKKFLYIKIHKEMTQVVEELCKESGFSLMDIGHSVGFIASKGEDVLQYLVSLNQIFFFAGVMYAKKYPKQLKYTYTDKEHKSEMDKLKKTIANKNKTPDYMG